DWTLVHSVLFGSLVEQIAEEYYAAFRELFGSPCPDSRNVRDRRLAEARGLKHSGKRLRDFAFDLGLAFDLDLHPDQRGGEPDVLSLLSDRQRQLIVLDDAVEAHRSVLVVNRRDASDLGRSERILSERDQIVGVEDHVDLFAVQLAHDRLDAAPAHADAGADRIDVSFTRAHRDLRALAGLPDRALDHDGSVVDLRHLHLEQPDHEARIGPREDELRPFRIAVHIEQDRADALSLSVALGARLLIARHDRLGLSEIDHHVATLEPFDRATHQLAELGLELVVDVVS